MGRQETHLQKLYLLSEQEFRSHKNEKSSGKSEDANDVDMMTLYEERAFQTWENTKKNGIGWLIKDNGATGYRVPMHETPLNEFTWGTLMTLMWAMMFWTYFHDGKHFLIAPYLCKLDASEVSDEDLGL